MGASGEEIVHIRGAGGHIWPMALPLHETVAELVTKGEAVRVNEDGTDYVAADDAPEPKQSDEPKAVLEYRLEREPAPDAPVKPKAANPKADWVTYAGSVSDLSHDEADAMTKAQLVDRFG